VSGSAGFVDQALAADLEEVVGSAIATAGGGPNENLAEEVLAQGVSIDGMCGVY